LEKSLFYMVTYSAINLYAAPQKIKYFLPQRSIFYFLK